MRQQEVFLLGYGDTLTGIIELQLQTGFMRRMAYEKAGR